MHLGEETKIAGHVQYHWLYSIEQSVTMLGCIGWRQLYRFSFNKTCLICFFLTGIRIIGIMISFVRDRSHHEGSIAEGCITLECLTICFRYIHDVETKFTWQVNYVMCDVPYVLDDGMTIFCREGKPLVIVVVHKLTHTKWQECHRYVLNQYVDVKPFIEYVLLLMCKLYTLH